MVQLSIQAVNNQNLFSNHYLKNLIRKNDEWRSNDHKTVFDEIKKIYNAEKPFLEDLNESQLEERFFRRIFKVMLPDFEVQAGTESQDFPDYAFFGDANTLNAAHLNKGSRSFYQNAFAIGEVKRWNTNLDRFGKGKHDKNMNPSFQVWVYLHETEPGWGILSNGRLWRVYHKDKPMDSYYEVDLVTILEKEDIDAFKYFYYFFRREAFFPSQKGAIFLENVLRGSEDYATEIGEDLKENVYRAMKILAEGFFRHPANGLDRNDENARSEVQSTTMRLLYRFLFLLYAEGKGLLYGSAYIESPYSFYSIKNKIKEEKDSRNAILEEGSRYWTELQDLFGLIDAGNETLGIPAYNGGLFDSERNPNLLKWRIGDRYLADAIDRLSRSDVGNDGRRRGFVDYSSLDIRHLGSIYEGLLEYRLRVAETNMVATGGKKREWVSLEDFNRSRKRKKNFSDFDLFDRVKNDELYLSTDKGERKATGSYYTPDYIVNYIVKNTIDPVVDERWQKAKARNESLIDATLSVKVLDPAMGSGHFLVGTLEHLSARLMEAVRVEAVSGRITDDAKDRYTLEWAKREVASHCIYGVDLNYLAVELAKVSLWLKTIAMDKPLSFLDHRLKCGNSLIGAKLVDLKEYPSSERRDKKKKAEGQSMFPSFVSRLFIDHLIGKIGELEGISDDSLSNIKRKERVFEEFRQLPEYRKAKAMADVHTAVYFGNEVGATANKKPEDVYHDIIWAIKGDEAEWQRKTNRAWFKEAQQIAEGKSFFHWELEFPEIFFDEGEVKENPGWDCVIGNPPYVSYNTKGGIPIPENEYSFYQNKFQFLTNVKGRARLNSIMFFIENGLRELSTNNRLGFIVNQALLGVGTFNYIRKYILDDCIIDAVVTDVPFGEVIADTCIIILKNDHSRIQNNRNCKIRWVPDIFKPKKEILIKQSFFGENKGYEFVFNENLLLLNKIDKISKSLGKVSHTYRGMQITKEDFLSDEKINEKYHKCLSNDNVDRYASIYPSEQQIDPNKGRKKYIIFDRQIEARVNIRLEKSGSKTRVAIGKTPSRFLQPKIFVRQAPPSAMLCAFYDDKNFFSDYTLHVINEKDLSLKFILCLLNSGLLSFYALKKGILYTGEKRTPQIMKKKLEQLPIRRINFTTSPEERTVILESLKSSYTANEFDEILQAVEECLPKDAEGNFITTKEKSDVIHDLLTFLAERMIEMNKDKNEEIKGFLEWFEREIGAKIETLTNRTKLKQYYDLDFDELLGILKKNKKKIPVNLSNRELQGNLNEGFEGSMEKLKPLIERTERTDRLIDLVVYRLYGLSVEEIKVVEGDN